MVVIKGLVARIGAEEASRQTNINLCDKVVHVGIAKHQIELLGLTADRGFVGQNMQTDPGTGREDAISRLCALAAIVAITTRVVIACRSNQFEETPRDHGPECDHMKALRIVLVPIC